MTARAALQHDLTPARWVIDRLHVPRRSEPFLVRSFVPAVFDAYAKVLHRAEGRRWAEVAAEHGTTVGPDTVWAKVVGPRTDDYPTTTPRGLIDAVSLAALLELLHPQTGTPASIWMALWEGYGDLQLPDETPRFAYGPWEGPAQDEEGSPMCDPGWAPYPGLSPSPFRAYFLFHGPLDVVRGFPVSAGWPGNEGGQTPNIWWPDDHAWCVATEIDHVVSYVGGSHSLIDGILDGPDLEAWPIEPDDLGDSGIDGVHF